MGTVQEFIAALRSDRETEQWDTRVKEVRAGPNVALYLIL